VRESVVPGNRTGAVQEKSARLPGQPTVHASRGTRRCGMVLRQLKAPGASRWHVISAYIGFGAVIALAFRHQGGDTNAPEPLAPVTQPATGQSDHPSALHGTDATLFCIGLLESGRQWLAQRTDYTATFYKQELLAGKLSPRNQIQLKIRHAPFSVYMRWQSPNEGREVIYREGAHDNQLLVHEGSGLASFLVPVLKLDPNGELAMSNSRHPVTEIGLLNLTDRLLEVRRNDLENPKVHVTMCEAAVDQRSCYQFEFLYPENDAAAHYHKVVVCIDKDLRIPVACRTYDWPAPEASAELPLLEDYIYTDLQFNQSLNDLAFDHQNPDYGYRRL
jgi:hypothetical protein